MFNLQMEILVLISLLTGFSGFILNYGLGFRVSLTNRIVPLACTTIGAASAFLLQDPGKALVFFAAATTQFIAFVFVSRLRQRGSFFWHAMAGLASNGAWYATMHIFDGVGAYWIFLFPFMAGILSGRTIGVLWAQYIEKIFNLKADATRDDRLAAGKRLRLISQEPTFWTLTGLLILYILYGLVYFESAIKYALLIVVGLGLLQNFFIALTTRAAQRGNNWYIAITGVCSGATFLISATYLFSQNLPMELVIPYMLSTALGSTTGAVFSMIIEWRWSLAPDQHLGQKTGKDEKKQSRTPYVIFATLAVIWILASESIFGLLGYETQSIKFPIPIPGLNDLHRTVIMLAASLVFFLDTALHTVTSRAGNRNHTGYHVSACIPKGAVDFSRMGFLSMNSSIPEIVPLGILSSCLGSLFGKSASERIERWLEARMDIVEDRGGKIATPQPSLQK